jgi:putative membrane protein
MTTQPQPPSQPADPGPVEGSGPLVEPRSPATGEAPAAPSRHPLRRTRFSGAWTAVASFAIVLLLLLIFILQNSRSVEVSYFGAHGHLPLGVALLLAAVCGGLLVGLAGGARILELRATARRRIPPPPPPADDGS